MPSLLLGVGLLVVAVNAVLLERAHPSHQIITNQNGAQTINPAVMPVLPPEATELKRSSTRAVPILMYHYIRVVTDARDRLGYNLSVTPSDFEAQLAWLEKNHYATYPLADFAQGKIPKTGKPIILTFDDGYADAYTAALPALQKHHFSATFFIVSGFINRPAYMNSVQLRDLRQAGMEIGAHTINHIDLAIATPAKQKAEIEGSKQASMVFAYPSGRYTDVTINLLKQAGFTCAVTTKPGIADEKSPLYELPRVRIAGGMSLETFSKLVQGIPIRAKS